MPQLTTDVTLDPEDLAWLKREAKARQMSPRDLIAAIVGEFPVRLERPMTEEEMSALLIRHVQRVIKLARRAARSRDG